MSDRFFSSVQLVTMMTNFAITLVLAAAFAHAGWNFLTKQANGGSAFVWLFGSLSACIYAPIALIVLIWQHPPLTAITIGFMVGSGLIHSIYFLLLQQGYRIGDLSLVYPLARGTGPLLAMVTAIILLGERPSLLAIVGALLIASGIVLLTMRSVEASGINSRSAANSQFAANSQSAANSLAMNSSGDPSQQPSEITSPNYPLSILFALLTGVCIAVYTLWDKYAVSQLLIPPLVLDWSANVTRSLLLLPWAIGRWSSVTWQWQHQRRAAIGVAILCPLAYILVLTALVFSPVSYVAPMREISIVIAAMLGTQILVEGNAVRRLAAASLMVLGAIAIAIG